MTHFITSSFHKHLPREVIPEQNSASRHIDTVDGRSGQPEESTRLRERIRLGPPAATDAVAVVDAARLDKRIDVVGGFEGPGADLVQRRRAVRLCPCQGL